MSDIPQRLRQTKFDYGGLTVELAIMGEAADYIDALLRRLKEVEAALRGLHDDVDEYQRINHLGGHDNHWMVAARKALASQGSGK